MEQGLCRVAMVGSGCMARHPIRQMLKLADNTQISVICEPNPEAYAVAAEIFTVDDPPSLCVWEQFLAVRAGQIPNLCPPEVGIRVNRL